MVDPVTRDAQKLAPVLLVGCRVPAHVDTVYSNMALFVVLDHLPFDLWQVLKKLVNVNLRVFMNCQSKLSEMPLKRWGANGLNSSTALSLITGWIFSCPISYMLPVFSALWDVGNVAAMCFSVRQGIYSLIIVLDIL